jgi:hypothetical protein
LSFFSQTNLGNSSMSTEDEFAGKDPRGLLVRKKDVRWVLLCALGTSVAAALPRCLLPRRCACALPPRGPLPVPLLLPTASVPAGVRLADGVRA